MTERHVYYLVPGLSGEEATADVYGSYAEIAAKLASEGSDPERIEISFAKDAAGTKAPPPKKPKQVFYYDTHLIGSDGDGSEQNPWPDVAASLEGLAALESSGKLPQIPGESIVVERREIFTATSLEDKKRRIESIAKYAFMLMAIGLVLPVLAILGYLGYMSIPAFFPGTIQVSAREVGATGISVRKLIETAGDSADVIRGVGVVGVDDSNGTWEYYSKSDKGWKSFSEAGVVTRGKDDRNAVVLNNTGRLRFTPNQEGELSGRIICRRWYDLERRRLYHGNTSNVPFDETGKATIEVDASKLPDPRFGELHESRIRIHFEREGQTLPEFDISVNGNSKTYAAEDNRDDENDPSVRVATREVIVPSEWINEGRNTVEVQFPEGSGTLTGATIDINHKVKSGSENIDVAPRWYEFITWNPKNNMTAGGIWAPFIGTFFLVMVSLLVSAPIGILAGVYLNEYATDNWFTRIINLAVVNLAGVPSIVHALFGVGAFVIASRFGESLLAAACTLAVMTLPVIITSTREALAAVPMSFRMACWNMGATKWQTIRTIVLPNSISGILTGVILQVSRAAGETAPILFTGAAFYMSVADQGAGYWVPYGLWDKIMALAMHLFTVMTQVNNAPQGVIYGTAIVLIGLVLAVNSIAILMRMYLRSRKKW